MMFPFQNITQVSVKDGSTANDQFQQAWGRRTEASTDYGPASQNASVVCQFNLEVVSMFLLLEKVFCKN